MSKTDQGNPEIGMSEESIDAAAQEETQQVPTGSVDSFFEQLENQVNGGIQETKATQNQNSGPQEEVTRIQQDNGPTKETPIKTTKDSHNWEKRYKDSSKEAIKLKEQMSGVKPFVPVLEAMKKDPGLVQHVRDYLQNGGNAQAKSLEEKLGLDEDFVFDLQEAVSDPNSDSAKLANVYLGNIVNQRVGNMVEKERKVQTQQMQLQNKAQQEAEFKKRHNMSDEQFIAFAEEAQKRTLTLDDVNYLLNRDKANKNVATSTKKDMLQQMKNVKNMPASASSANSVKTTQNESDSLFDALAGLDGGVDNLFG
jgi:septal ring factor EnvC (AmiA/AmiB activator)